MLYFHVNNFVQSTIERLSKRKRVNNKNLELNIKIASKLPKPVNKRRF